MIKKDMHKFAAFLMCALCVIAQESKPADTAQAGEKQPEKVPSEKAPPEVDAALRARVTQFYQAHVDGKYRLADQVVAEESKDMFFAAAKPKYDGFNIVKVSFYDDFKKADAVVACKGIWYIRGEKMPVTMPISSTWKLIDGQWFWYVIPVTEVKTPFGNMHYNSGKEASSAPVPALPGDPKVLAEQILSQVQLDKKDLMLSSYEASKGEVKIKNGMPGAINLRLDLEGAFPGLRATLDKTKVEAGETAVLTVTCNPKDPAPKPTLTARIYIEPTMQVIPVKLTFAIQPELEQKIPKELRQNLPQQH